MNIQYLLFVTRCMNDRYEFFNDLYHRFLLTPKVQMKCMCLQAMTIVYGKCHEEIGAFNDTRYIVGMLERVTLNNLCLKYVGFYVKINTK